ncbi:MAG: CoA-binding protein, partial [Verrucomicrobia bacterium]|nr:CoA-binding protein [Verrucomicrobiota bacterium]
MLESLLTPEIVAVLGASRNPGKVGHAFVANLIKSAFKGTIVPVNPEADEILGLKCYKSLEEFGGKIDLGIIVVPPRFVKDAIQASANAGAKQIIIITAGFKEVGEEGAKDEEEIAQLCRSLGMRLMGPNCLGVLNTHHQMNATFAPALPPPGGISLISQSGALCVAILDWASKQKLGMSKVFSIGNKADLNEADFLQTLGEDKQTAVVACYLESITEGNRFLRVAEEVASIKPVVVLKVGVTSAGAKAASSHTGSLAGADIAYGAAFKRSGIIRAENFEALFDYALAFATQPMPQGNRVAVITNAGGPGIMAADSAEMCGLKMVAPSDATKARLQEFLPAAASFSNPIDVLGDAEPDRYIKSFELAQNDDAIDAIVVVVTPQNMTAPLQLAQQLAIAHQGKKPLLTAFMGGDDVEQAKEKLMALGIPNYPSPDRAMGALRAMCDYNAWRRRPPRIVTRFPVNRRRVDRVLQMHLRTGQLQMGEVEAKEVLRA